MKKRTGVLLINLGTPDSPKVRDVRRYLSEFLNDPRVIDLPWLGRKALVNLIIVPFRAPKSAKIYKELWEHGGGKSPLLEYGFQVRDLLQEAIGKNPEEEVTVEIAMRYGQPSLNKVLDKMHKANYDKIIVLPLFPQYSSAATGSAIEKALRLIKNWWVMPEIRVINQFYDHPLFIETVVEQAKKYNLKEYDHILFSYHGLPTRQVDKVYNDGLCEDQPCETEINEENKLCYKATSYATTRLIAQELDLQPEDYTTCFQSRLDKNWLEPFSDKVVEEWGKKGAKKLLVFSPAFVADCLETIIEIGDEYQEIFEEHGGEKVQLVESLNTRPKWIACLKDLVEQQMG